MHFKNLNFFCYIDSYNSTLIKKLPNTTSVIYRNYKDKIDINTILKIKNDCKKNNLKFYLSNNVKLAIKLDLNGSYIPAFNKELTINLLKYKKDFKILGSAHNIKEIRIKELQNVEYIFLSPLFASNKNKNCLEIYRFKSLMKLSKKKIIALGGISAQNLKKLNLIKPLGIASISLYSSYHKLK